MVAKYWCYVCQRQFQQQDVATKCPTCQQEAFQQMTAQSHPQQFQAYQALNSPSIQSTMNQVSVSIGPAMQQLNQSLQGFTSIIQNTSNSLSNSFSQNPQSFGDNPASIIQNAINFSLAQIFSNLPQIMNLTGQISSLMQNLINSGQSYRPATSQEIQALVKIQKPNQCAICQSESEHQGGGLRLNCGHQFHCECILPWFQRANTCPTCRNAI